MTILVTGFEPFGDQTINASWEVASRLPSEINGVKIIVMQLPVVYHKSIAAIAKTLEGDNTITDVIMLGEAGGRTRISIEMIGVNMDDASIPDNAGVLHQGTPIYEQGSDAYFATIPVKKIVEHLVTKQQVPAYSSWSAGQFLCNHVLYGVLHMNHANNRKTRAGFVHLPYTCAQGAAANLAGLPTSEMVRGIESLLAYLVDN